MAPLQPRLQPDAACGPGCSVRKQLQRVVPAAARGSSCSARRAAARGSSVEGRRDCSMPIARGRRLQRSRGAEIRGGKIYFFTEVPLSSPFVGQMPLRKNTKLHPPEIHQRTLISLDRAPRERLSVAVRHDLIFRTVAHRQEKAPSRAVIGTGTTAGPGSRPLRSLSAA